MAVDRVAVFAITESGSARWLVWIPILVLILFLYFLLFVAFPNIDRRARLAWAICAPLSLVLFAIEVPLQEWLHLQWAGEAIHWIALILMAVPFLFMPPNPNTPHWLRGRARILLIPAALIGVIVVRTLNYVSPDWLRSPFLVPALIAWVCLIVLISFLRDRRKRVR